MCTRAAGHWANRCCQLLLRLLRLTLFVAFSRCHALAQLALATLPAVHGVGAVEPVAQNVPALHV